MSNYSTATLVKAQLALQGAMANQDKRFRDPKVHKLFLSNSENFFPNYKALRTSEKRTLEASVYKRTARNLVNGRSHNHTGNNGDSFVLTPTWLSKADTFSMTLKQQDSSVLQDQFNDMLFNAVANHMEGLEALASDTLVNNRTGVNNATTDGTFDTTNDVFEINATDNGVHAPFIAKMVMEINKYNGQFVFVCDPISFRKFMALAAQGVSNATNYSFQFMDMEFVLDTSLTAKAVAIDASYTKGFWEVVPKNAIGALDWIPRQNVAGTVTSVDRFASIVNPFDGLTYALHSYEQRADGSGRGGELQDVLTEFELSIDIAYELAPLSTSDETVVYAFALV